MVSLSRSINTNSGGATFFGDSDTMDNRDLQPILESYGVFKPLKTIPVFSIHLVYTLALELLAIIYAVIHPDERQKCLEYFIIIYLHVGLWFLTLVLDQIARVKHFNLRMNGYLDFYKQTQVHHRLPLYVVSTWGTVLMLLQALLQHFYPDNFAEQCLRGGFWSPLGYLCAFITVEFCLIAGININYILKVRLFNKLKSPPDVQKEEWSSVANADAVHQEEVGYRHLGDKLYDFVEKQADLIRHLKDHNAKLGGKIVLLNAQLKNKDYQQTSQQEPL